MSPTEPTVSIKLLWPFVRLLGADLESARLLARYGVLAPEFADPATRLPGRAIEELLAVKLGAVRHGAAGVEAAAIAETGDVAPIIHVARTQASLRAALRTIGRYVPLLHEEAELTLTETGDGGVVSFGLTSGRPAAPEIAGFALAMLVRFVRENTAQRTSGAVVRFRHPRPSDISPYESVFGGGSVSFGAGTDSLSFTMADLDTSMRSADHRAKRAFELRAESMLAELAARRRTSRRVRELLIRNMSGRSVTMSWVAEQLGTSPATLRRHLESEGTCFSTIREETRHRHAEDRLANSAHSVSEIAFELGFSNPAGFCRAFKRRTGLSPADFRHRTRQKVQRR